MLLHRFGRFGPLERTSQRLGPSLTERLSPSGLKVVFVLEIRCQGVTLSEVILRLSRSFVQYICCEAWLTFRGLLVTHLFSISQVFRPAKIYNSLTEGTIQSILKM